MLQGHVKVLLWSLSRQRHLYCIFNLVWNWKWCAMLVASMTCSGVRSVPCPMPPSLIATSDCKNVGLIIFGVAHTKADVYVTRACQDIFIWPMEGWLYWVLAFTDVLGRAGQHTRRGLHTLCGCTPQQMGGQMIVLESQCQVSRKQRTRLPSYYWHTWNGCNRGVYTRCANCRPFFETCGILPH